MSYGDNTLSDNDMILGGVKDVDGPYDHQHTQAVDIPEITATKRPQRAKPHKLASPCASGPAAISPLSTKHYQVPCKLRCSSRVGAKGQLKSYVLAEDRPPTSKGTLLLLDAPPGLPPQRSTRSGKVFKPPEGEGGSSSEQSGDNESDSEEERRVNRSRRSREDASDE